MKQPLLTIAIPTYNRAHELDKQLAWAVNAIDGRWDEVELIVSDNASPDETPQICQSWQYRSQNHLGVFRQPDNIGIVRNCLFCVQQARGEYVWLVSDDDRIAPHTLNRVLDWLTRKHGCRLSFLHLNGNKATPDGAIVRAGVYPFQDDLFSASGTDLFRQCADIYEDWMMLITANIYSTAVAKAAIQHWPGVSNNLAFPLYLAGYAAARGAMAVCAPVCLTDNLAYSRANWIHIIFHDIPQSYWHLRGTGMPESLIRRRIMTRISFLAFMVRFPKSFLRSLRFYWQAAQLPKS
ncbi:MAG: glycosyltransferase family 2 protein [Thermoflexales bacterium]|nr:glycosyltransferase family 2 protein [Thermoflexales bacterium]MDW8352775.1 glycosyltransferase family 2 protein [Anaerolineae bacterium]